MLETTLANDLAPGSNLRRAGPDTTWLHLLDDPAPALVVSVGHPPADAWARLVERCGRAVVLLPPAERPGAPPATGAVAADGAAHHAEVAAADGAAHHAEVAAADGAAHLAEAGLVLVPSRAAARWLVRRWERHGLPWAGEGPALWMAADVGARLRRRLTATVSRRRPPRLAPSPPFAVLAAGRPAAGAAGNAGRPAGAAGAAGTAGASVGLLLPARRRGLGGGTRPRARAAARLAAARVLRLLRWPHLPAWARRHAADPLLLRPAASRPTDRLRPREALLRPAASRGAGDLPAYVRDLAARGGLDLDGAPWQVAPARGYASQKILFLVEGGGRPRLAVKVTQEPRFNARLLNEARALESLAALPLDTREVAPRLRFRGTCGGLAVVGQSFVAGAPLRRVSTARPDCPAAAAALDWLLSLGQATADHGAAHGPVAAESLATLCDRFVSLFDPPAEHRSALAAARATLADSAWPAVLTHGDPGVHNLLVTPTGRVAFLDWENADEHGLPLWDVFLLLRSFGNFVAESRGLRRGADLFARQFGGAEEVSPPVAATLERYRAAVEMDRAAVRPLFLLCWVHQAVKEASRHEVGDTAANRSLRLAARGLADAGLPVLPTGGAATGRAGA